MEIENKIFKWIYFKSRKFSFDFLVIYLRDERRDTRELKRMTRNYEFQIDTFKRKIQFYHSHY